MTIYLSDATEALLWFLWNATPQSSLMCQNLQAQPDHSSQACTEPSLTKLSAAWPKTTCILCQKGSQCFNASLFLMSNSLIFTLHTTLWVHNCPNHVLFAKKWYIKYLYSAIHQCHSCISYLMMNPHFAKQMGILQVLGGKHPCRVK